MLQGGTTFIPHAIATSSPALPNGQLATCKPHFPPRILQAGPNPNKAPLHRPPFAFVLDEETRAQGPQASKKDAGGQGVCGTAVESGLCLHPGLGAIPVRDVIPLVSLSFFFPLSSLYFPFMS